MVDHHPGFSGPAHPELEPHGTRTGRFPAEGRHNHGPRLEWSRLAPGSATLSLGSPGATLSAELTPADVHALRAGLNAAGDLSPLRDQARALGDVNWEYHPGELARSAVDLVDAAHAAGYRLRDEDGRVTGADAAATAEAARDHLIALLAQGAAPGEGWAHGDAEALMRVIALLDPS
jgi:hypothetical protein